MDWKIFSKTISKAVESAQEMGEKAIDIVNSSKKNLDVIQKASDILKGEGDLITKGTGLFNLANTTINSATEYEPTKICQSANQPQRLQNINPAQSDIVIDKRQSEQPKEILVKSAIDTYDQTNICEDNYEEQDEALSLVDGASIITGVEAANAIAAMGVEIARAIQVCQIEETKRTVIKAKMDVEVTRINAISKLLSDYLDKTFDERSELFDNYFRVLDKAIEKGDTALMSATLGSINSLASQSPFKNLADFATVQQQLGQADTEWDI